MFIGCLCFSSCTPYDKTIMQEFRLEVFSKIVRNSCAKSSVNPLKECAVFKNLAKNLADWN